MRNVPGFWQSTPRKLLVCLFAILAAACFNAGCDSTDCTGAYDGGPIGRLISLTGCKTWQAEADTTVTPSNLDCIKWHHDGEGLLLITHVNAGFNCCPTIDVDAYVEGDTIFIKEHEIEGLCDCICLFDLYYDFHGLETGVYRVSVSEECLGDGDEPLDFIMDLTAWPSGSYCVERDHYPWGH